LGAWGLGVGAWPPTPNPQSPIPNPHPQSPLKNNKNKIINKTKIYLLILIILKIDKFYENIKLFYKNK
jgi:hypothetical protein